MLDDSLVSASIARTSRWARVALLLIPALALGQLSTNSVTVTPTEAPALQPDGAYFDVSVTSGSDKTLNDIVTALQGSGITAANFERLTSLLPAARTATPPQPSFQWTFQTLVPLTKLKETTAAFTTLAQRLPQNNSGLSLTFSVAGTAASAQQTTSCKLSDLVASARAQAQQLTSAAGLTSGMIVSLTAATSPSAPTPCSLAVRFALGTQLIQTEPSSITIAASRPLSVQPDQIAISLSASSDPSLGLDDVTAALQQAGLSGVNFTGLYTSTIYVTQGAAPPKLESQLQWSFTVTAPLAKFADTISQILSAEQALTKAGSGVNVALTAAVPQVSAQSAQSQTCPDTDLVKDAQAQAQSLAAAAGVKAGALLTVGSSSATGLVYPVISQYQWVSPALSSCSMTVVFQLLQQ